MDAKIKRKWVKALRSGKYKQAEVMLRDPVTGAMCCLGVLCRIQGAAPKSLDYQTTATVPKQFNAGLKEAERETLAAMNDGEFNFVANRQERKRTFKGIATWIEKNL